MQQSWPDCNQFVYSSGCHVAPALSATPLRYHLTPDGRYQLYGIGWNERDDGGQVAWSDSKRLDIEKGDWVWQYTELQPPTPVVKK